ncbi:putative oxidoreductase, aryl-alcohol dehydrogenase like protein (plasmid) [Mycobacterium sp. JS623]|uniref:aldo/keto reductase n=1 Tax=Mycobacterium sp. JS623 TaxID=212767 RepID=UPI0002A550C0|nr:aldo/keto reductase [Mycobacterium sp. JS623]AGB26656.1 putative oxidoreductase, aryl-alcohol dehydrogenase like protein [Mycobacterium sp. JS623]
MASDSRVLSLGFGCAGLFGLPTERERREVLEVAYDTGIRHFDVAPMYGMGRAERELGRFIRNRPDVKVATKFGIRTTVFGRFAGCVQAPIRRVLASSAKAKAKVKQSGAKPDAGVIGRVLYTDRDYSVDAASRALAASLRTMQVDRIDYFFLHEPAGMLCPGDSAAIGDFLDVEQQRGAIGRWGPAGDLSQVDSELAELIERATVRQSAYDLMGGHSGPVPGPKQTVIVYGFMSSALPNLVALFEGDAPLRRRCSDLLDVDLLEQRNVVRFLVRDSLLSNHGATVLISSTKPHNVGAICQAAQTPMKNETQVSTIIRNRFRGLLAQ